MKKEKIRVLLVAHNLDDFVGQDLEILERHFDVRVVAEHKSKMNSLKKLASGVKWCDVCYIWFAASYAALTTILCKTFRKKSIIISGGYDIVCMPEINYGLLCDKRQAIYPKTAIKLADKILAFSEASRRDIIENFKIKNKEKVKKVYLYIEPKKYPAPKQKKKEIVITIGEVRSSTIQRKGLETFVKAAAFLPDKKFVLIGKFVDETIEHLKKIAGKNVEFTGFLQFEKMLKLMQEAKVYCQLSAHEGFGFSLAEAMLCECIPVCTTRGSLPEVAGKEGYFVPYGNAEKSAEAIKKALSDNEQKGKKARQWVINRFPKDKREKEIVKEIEELVEKG